MKRSFFNIETIIVLLIAGCMIFLNAFTTQKLNELDAAGDNALFIRQDLPYEDSEVLAEEIVQYHPDTCKMIEMYDENFEMVFSIQFDQSVIECNSIHDYPDLINLFKQSKEGQTIITMGNTEQYVYFQWTPNNRGDNRLIVIYSAKVEVQNIWIFTFVCYLVLIMVFILLIRLHYKHYLDKIAQYKNISKDAHDEINNK